MHKNKKRKHPSSKNANKKNKKHKFSHNNKKEDIKGSQITLSYSSDTTESLSESEGYLNHEPFPFHINENKRGKIGERRYDCKGSISSESYIHADHEKVNYVINIPVLASEQKKSVKFNKMIEKESFGQHEKESSKEVKQRTSAVMGINAFKSVIPENNTVLKDEINKSISSNFPYKRFGFFWKPQWELIKSQGFTIKLTEKKSGDSISNIKKQLSPKDIPLLVRIKSTGKVYIYGKWFDGNKELKPLDSNLFKHIDFSVKKSMTISTNTNSAIFREIIRKHGHADRSSTKAVGLGTVRKWYKKLSTNTSGTISGKMKKFAKNHITQEESKNKLKMIPYREIRNTLKDSEQTKEMVKKARLKSNKNNEVYMAFFDNSTETFRTKDGVGILSHYDHLLSKGEQRNNQKINIASTGYSVNHKHYPLTALSISIDMHVRTATNKHLPNAIYIPEPNILVRVLPKQDTIEERFGENTTTQGNYKSPKETPLLIKNIIENRKLNLDAPGIIFDGRYALQIEPRKRMLMTQRTSNKRKEYHGIVSKDGITRWNEQDFKNFYTLSQSHYKPREWSNHILQRYELDFESKTKHVKFNNRIYALSKKQVIDSLKSLLSRLFTAYEPYSIAKSMKHKSFVKRMIEVIKNYDEIDFKIHPYLPLKKRSCDFLSACDKINSLKKLIRVIQILLTINHDEIKKIHRAAEDSGKAVQSLLKESLCLNYPALIYSLLEDFVIEVFDNCSNMGAACHLKYEAFVNGKNHKAIIYNKFNYQFKINKAQINERGEYGMTCLHFAAISGNTQYVERLCQLPGANNSINAECGIQPIHCAIKYCSEHDVDVKLISLVANKSNLRARLIDGRTAIYLILTEIEFPKNIIDELFKQQHLSKYEYKLLKLYITLLNNDDGLEVTPDNPISNIIKGIDDVKKACDLIKLFIQLGADCDGSREYYDPDNIPIFVAMVKNSKLITKTLLVNANIQLTKIADTMGNPPLLAAMKRGSSLDIIKLLYEFGADFTERNEIYGVYPLQEAISSALGIAENFDLVKYIIKVCPDAIDNADCGGSPLKVALDVNDEETIKLLIKAEADIDEKELSSGEIRRIREITGEPIYSKKERKAAAKQEHINNLTFFVHIDNIDYLSEDSETEGINEEVRAYIYNEYLRKHS